MSDTGELNGLIAANLQTSANMLNAALDRENQNEINRYNNDVNRQNMLYQNAVASANETEARIYNSPVEQLRRLTAAGVNAFTATDMLSSGEGSSAGSASASPSSAVASPVNMDLSALVDAMSRLDEMHFTNDQNRKAARETMDQLMVNLQNQVEMQGRTIEESKRAQKAQFADNDTQRAWQASQNAYQRGHDLITQDAQNRFTASENATQRKWQSSENATQRSWQNEESEKQQVWQSSENATQRKWQSYENEENRWLQNWTGESGVGFDLGLLKLMWKSKDILDDRYKGSRKSYYDTSAFDYFFK